jgi:hypothetical protein
MDILQCLLVSQHLHINRPIPGIQTIRLQIMILPCTARIIISHLIPPPLPFISPPHAPPVCSCASAAAAAAAASAATRASIFLRAARIISSRRRCSSAWRSFLF